MNKKNWPKLSETLPHSADDLHNCQACGSFGLIDGGGLFRWQECDEKDSGTGACVILCESCAFKIIEPHPRLYKSLSKFEPFAGAMSICIECVHRTGAKRTHPKSKWNGGPGMVVTIEKPQRAMVDGSKYSGPIALYFSPATACECQQTQNEPQ